MAKLQYWLLTWTEYDLPGGFLGKFIPDHLKPLLGQAKPCVEICSSGKAAVRKVGKLGPLAHPRLYWCEGTKKYEKKIEFEIILKINGEVVQ